MKAVILTGLRTNAEYHLGNYLGAILPMATLQRRHVGAYQVNMFAPDLHSFTTPINHSELYRRTMDNLRVFIAAGIPLGDKHFYLYRQSYIPAHAELTVILNNFAYYGELKRMTQFKEKADELKHKSVSAGLFDYPVLMAADILLYGAKWVPVGDDQQQHLEFARDLGDRFNQKFGPVLTLPEPIDKQLKFVKRTEGVRIRSLRSPTNKMSKSVTDPAGTILLSDKPADGRAKVMAATTDSLNAIHWDWELQPGVTNLLQISSLLAATPATKVLAEWQGRSDYRALKKYVGQQVSEFLTEFQIKLKSVDKAAVLAKLEASEAAMSQTANQTLFKVQQAIGLRP
ncbi:MAG TPA: tryptophan--tRNA ligase [Candidatus Saccharimonadales bacterium]